MRDTPEKTTLRTEIADLRAENELLRIQLAAALDAGRILVAAATTPVTPQVRDAGVDGMRLALARYDKRGPGRGPS